jgi:metallo-beta-lactamase family protein
VTFRNAGHILDSAIIEIEYKENGENKKIVFSGDLGNHNDLVMSNPVTIEKTDTLYIESTYGDRNHKGIKDSEDEFKSVVIETLLNEGNILIPSFAIERTQEILCILKRMYDKKELPVCKIYIDSPMAIRATRLYDQYHEELSEYCNNLLKRDGSIFEFPYVHFTIKPEESKKINEERTGCIIIAGSGMCSGGRILHHFKQRLWNERNSVLFVGYQAKGTLGRSIVDGERFVKIYHEKIIVKAKIYTINGFSAHADQSDLIEWMQHFKKLTKIYLVHGEREKQEIFKKVIKERMGKKSHIVKEAERIWI